MSFHVEGWMNAYRPSCVAVLSVYVDLIVTIDQAVSLFEWIRRVNCTECPVTVIIVHNNDRMMFIFIRSEHGAIGQQCFLIIFSLGSIGQQCFLIIFFLIINNFFLDNTCDLPYLLILNI